MTTYIPVSGLSADLTQALEKKLLQVPGVVSAKVEFNNRRAVIQVARYAAISQAIRKSEIQVTKYLPQKPPIWS